MTQIAFERFVPSLRDGAMTWASEWIEPGFPIADVVPSWNATAPTGSWIDVRLQGRAGTSVTGWYELGRWSSDPSMRTSIPGQDDDYCRVDVDTLVSREGLDACRVAVELQAGTTVGVVTLVASSSRSGGVSVASETILGEDVDLPVPPYSQLVHAGHFPEYDGGGASWCSAASTAMLVAYWGRGPTEEELSWVGEGHLDACVDHAARGTYDAAYAGCGNWAFNTAYAATFGLEAFVTRLGSLREAETFLAAGIPLGASIAAAPGDLDGFCAAGSAGHIVVIRGVTARGDPIVNDPAAPSDGEVARVYDRAQFERAWLLGSGGIVYVARPPERSLPG